MSIFFILSCSCAFGDAPHSRFWCLNPKLCLPDFLMLLVLALPQIYTRFFMLLEVTDLDSAWVEILALSIFFILGCSCAFSDAPHSRCRCLNPKLCLPDSLKLLVLALPEIYTRVFHLWKSIDLDSA